MMSEKQKILAVDDQPLNLKILEGILEKDYEILTAAN
jgi:CheY-like chemotaxis protein